MHETIGGSIGENLKTVTYPSELKTRYLKGR